MLTQKYIDGTMPHREFTDVARLVLGHAATRVECEDFWRCVAFANPTAPSGGTRARPAMTHEDWELTGQAIAETLEDLEPHALLVFGASLFDALTDQPSLGPLGRLAALRQRTAVVTHPGTAGFSFRDHQDEVRKLRLS
jgi:hypothetical protein